MKKSIQSTLYALLLCTLGNSLVKAAFDAYTDPFSRVDSGLKTSTDVLRRERIEVDTQRSQQQFARARQEEDRQQKTVPQNSNEFANEGPSRIDIQQQQREANMDTEFEQRQSNYWENRHWTTKIGHWFDRFSDEKTAQQALRGNSVALKELTETVAGWKKDPDKIAKIADLRASVIKDLVQQHNSIDANTEDLDLKNSIQRVLRKKALELLKLLNTSESTTPVKIEIVDNKVTVKTGHGTTSVFDGKTGQDITNQSTTSSQRDNPFAPTRLQSLTLEQFSTELQRLKIRTTTKEFATLTTLDSQSKKLLIDKINTLKDSKRDEIFIENFVKEFVTLTDNNNLLSKKDRLSTNTLIENAIIETDHKALNQKAPTQAFGQGLQRGLPTVTEQSVPAKIVKIIDQKLAPATRVVIPDTKSESPTRQPIIVERKEETQPALPKPLPRQDVVEEEPAARSATLIDQPSLVSMQPQAAPDQFQTALQTLNIPENLIQSSVLTNLDSASKTYLIKELKLLDPELQTKFVETFIAFVNDRQNIRIPAQELIDQASRKTRFDSLTDNIPDVVQPNIPAISRSFEPEAPLTQEQFEKTLSTLEIQPQFIKALRSKELDSISMQRLIDQAKKIEVPEIRNEFISQFNNLVPEDKKQTPEKIQEYIENADIEARSQALTRTEEKRAEAEARAKELAEKARQEKEKADAYAQYPDFTRTQGQQPLTFGSGFNDNSANQLQPVAPVTGQGLANTGNLFDSKSGSDFDDLFAKFMQ